ncbi:MAG: hypothetical protein AB8A40_01160 [Prochlorococcus sp.]
MSCRLPLMAFALCTGIALSPSSALAQVPTRTTDKVLAQGNDGFNVTAVQNLLDQGDAAVAAGNLTQARKDYDNARDASKQLMSFYRDLSGAFRGLDARIPRETDAKGRKALALLAQANLRLAALFRRQNQAEIAVPILIEVVKLMSPARPEGQKAYQSLIELGFVETPYAGAKLKTSD